MIISPKIKWRSYISWKKGFESLENVVVVVAVLNVVASQKLIRIPLHLPSCLVAASYSPRSNYESDNAEILIRLFSVLIRRELYKVGVFLACFALQSYVCASSNDLFWVQTQTWSGWLSFIAGLVTLATWGPKMRRVRRTNTARRSLKYLLLRSDLQIPITIIWMEQESQ